MQDAIFTFGINKYSISEFADDMLPKTSSSFNFDLLGLIHGDLHSGNKVAGRIVDIGGISSVVRELQDKLTLRYYKKIQNINNATCLNEYLDKLHAEMKRMNPLDRSKVQKAIELSEEHIKTLNKTLSDVA